MPLLPGAGPTGSRSRPIYACRSDQIQSRNSGTSRPYLPPGLGEQSGPPETRNDMAAENNSKLEGLRIERDFDTGEGSKAKLWVTLVIVFLLLGAGFWCLLGRSPGRPVKVAAVHSRPAGGPRQVLNASGYVTARRAATVSSKITGKVVEVLIEEGMHVKEGQILARLDDTNVKASLKLADAQLTSAKAALAETNARIKEAD